MVVLLLAQASLVIISLFLAKFLALVWWGCCVDILMELSFLFVAYSLSIYTNLATI